ncbi:MAG: glycosyltransferase family 4 protein [bacterium]|nr:glycosyltransferase family 4 protein [bacterium]
MLEDKLPPRCTAGRGKKRVLIFSTAYFPLIGGAEIAVREITNRINDIEFVMIAPRLKKDLLEKEKIDNVLIYRVGKGNNFDKFRLFFSGVKFAQSLGKFDIVWAIMASYAGLTALRFKKKNNDVKFLLTLQEGDSKTHIYKRVWFIWPYFKQIFKKADKIQAISKYLADWAREMGAKCEISVIPNGVAVKRESENNLHHHKCNHKKIITVSRLVEKNGVEDLIKSLSYLDNNVHLTILGDGVLRSHLESVVKDNGLNERVHFVGSVSPEDVYKHLAVANIFCRPSLSEGLGNAFLEAMAVSLPTIGTKVGGIPDFLIDDETSLPGQSPPSVSPGKLSLSLAKTSLPGVALAKTGWFCEVNNPESIAEKIKYILDEKNKEEVQKVVSNAKKMVEEKYNWELIAKDINNIFKNLCEY